MTGPDPLGPSPGCSQARRCEVCGGTLGLEVATYQMLVGVFCATVCWWCLRVGNAPPVRSWAQACERIADHCQHLGLDLDQMADLLEAECEEAAW
jgi:hypothetical protein